jgi:hypothetical protein
VSASCSATRLCSYRARSVEGPARHDSDAESDRDRQSEAFCWADWSPKVTRLNAPRQSGAKLIEPPLQLVGDLAATNKQTITAADYDIQGRGLAGLALEAHEQLLDEALRYTRGYRDVNVPQSPDSIFVAGHQPEMFHPGVWFKNFVLARLACEHRAVAINLQIDSDSMKATSIRVPGGSASEPRLESVAFDRAATPDTPFEQAEIVDRACFNSFGERAAGQIRPLVAQPLVEEYWPKVVARSHETGNWATCFTQARHQIEGLWGLQTLEIPQSRVCDLPAFRWFIVHLLAHLPRFWEIYNSALLEFRREHKVRSAAHPVPELAAVDGWIEAPLWIWSHDDPRRRRLFARYRNSELALTDRAGIEVDLPISLEGGVDLAIEKLADLSAFGIRIRTRALITTLAARLLLGDVFIHGIGGAKYDELTDRIICRFFGLTPPGYMVASGTLHLPVDGHSPNSNHLQELNQRIRELEFHPERFLAENQATLTGDGPAISAAVADKQKWVATPQNATNARERCRAIRRANESLQPAVGGLRDLWTRQAADVARRQRFEAILASREYAFVLFPEMALTSFLLGELENSAGGC